MTAVNYVISGLCCTWAHIYTLPGGEFPIGHSAETHGAGSHCTYYAWLKRVALNTHNPRPTKKQQLIGKCSGNKASAHKRPNADVIVAVTHTKQMSRITSGQLVTTAERGDIYLYRVCQVSHNWGQQ